MLTNDDDDAENKKLSPIVVNTLTLLVSQIPPNSQVLSAEVGEHY